MSTSTKDHSLVLIILSFAAVYIIWGSTYLFVAVAVEHIPPFLLSAMRYVAASGLLFALAAVLKQYQAVSQQQLKNAVLAGFLFIGCGTGGIAWALQFVDSGFTALIIAGQPLLVVLMMWAVDKKRPAGQSFIGIFLGIIGMYLLVSQGELVAQPQQWKGILMIFFCMLSWAMGSIFVSKADLPKPQMANSALQMLSGGLSLLICSLLLEHPLSFQYQEVAITAWLSLSFLVVFGAVIGFSAFSYLLSKVSPEKVATSTYVNPIIALFLGWWFRAELITVQSMVAIGIMFTGVFFINSSPEHSRNLIKRLRILAKSRV